MRVLFIVGWDRSGSTILANILGSTPGVVTLGEVNNLWERGFGLDMTCGCGAAFGRCEFWTPISTSAFGEDRSWVADRGRRAMARLGNARFITRRIPLVARSEDDDAATDYRGLLDPLYRAAVEHTRARLLIDASKTPWHAAIAEGIAGVEPFFLHLIRDPRGVASSFRKQVRYDVRSTATMDTHGLTRSSLIWLYRGSLIEAEWRRSPRYLRMRYEDLVADPVHHVAHILRWAGLPEVAPPFEGDRRVRLSLVHNISGNPVRFTRGSVELRGDEGWRTDLSPQAQRYVNLLTRPLLRRFGYRRPGYRRR